jgi:hypothetical protein
MSAFAAELRVFSDQEPISSLAEKLGTGPKLSRKPPD